MLSSLRTITSLGFPVVGIFVPIAPVIGLKRAMPYGERWIVAMIWSLLSTPRPFEPLAATKMLGVVPGTATFQMRSHGLEALSEKNSVLALAIQTGPSMNAK